MAYDNYLRQRMESLVTALGQGGVPVVLMSVARADVTNPDGSLAMVASPGRHAEINALLSQVASQDPRQVQVFDIDSIVSPHGHYASLVDGQQCRFSDDLHFTVFCGELVQPAILGLVQSLLPEIRLRG
jgi:hypothetical protein